MDDFSDTDDDDEGGAGWLMTFADLMSLLMSFFVLLLSFSEMDIQKYKQVAGSMKNAFGIQREVKSDVIPKGTSLIATEFSPGKPDPDSLIKEMRQSTTDDTKDNLDFDESEVSQQVGELAELLEKVFKGEIEENVLDLIIEGERVSIRIREKDSFPSGSAELNPNFFRILDNIGFIINSANGRIVVSGHTDNVPISTREYPSNWMLSSARASSVLHYLVENRIDDVDRVELRAYADTQPVVPNDSPINRARNRRIEIAVHFDENKNYNEEVVSPYVDNDYF